MFDEQSLSNLMNELNWIHDDYCCVAVFPSGEEQDNPLLQPQHSATW